MGSRGGKSLLGCFASLGNGEGIGMGVVVVCASSVRVRDKGDCFILLLPSDHCKKGVDCLSLGKTGLLFVEMLCNLLEVFCCHYKLLKSP